MAFKRPRGTGQVNTGWRLFKIPNLRWLWMAQTVSQIADGLNKVALIWLVYTITGSTLKTTVIGVLQTLPPLLFGPLMGVYVDRLPKKVIMMSVDALRAALVVAIPILHAFGALTMPRLYTIVVAMALVSTIFTPALEAAVPSIVEQGQLTAANALVNSTAMIGMLVGPAVSGLGIATIGLEKVLYVSSAAFVLSVLTLSRLGLKPQHHEKHAAKDGSFMEALKKGFRYVLLERRTIAAFVLTALLYSLAASAFVFLLPVYANNVLKAGPTVLGALWSSYGAGMVVVSAALAFVTQRNPAQRLLMIIGALGAGGLASFLLAGAASSIAGILLVAVVGAGLAAFTPIVWGLLQEMTPEELRGRVFGIFNTGAMATSMIGLVGFGWATDSLGPRPSLLAMSVIMWGSAAALVLLRQFGNLEPAQTVQPRTTQARAG
jgi:DHA3 family macrolide efflux protein-like MFS transporter